MLARNATWNLITQCIPMVVALAIMPRLIRGLGTERFGVMTLSWMVLGYFSLFDLGLGRALTKLVAERLGLGRRAEVTPLVWTSILLMTGLGLAGGIAIAMVTPWLVDRVLVIEGPLRWESLGAFYLMGLALPFVIGTAGLRGVLEAHQRFTGINSIRTVTSLFVLLAPLALLNWTDNLAAIVGVVCLGRFAAWVAHVVICLRLLPELRSGPIFQVSMIRPLLGFGGWMTAVNIINPLMVQMDRFLIGGLASAAAVAYYTTPQELITRAWFLSNAVLGVVFPAFATSFVRDRQKTTEIYGRCFAHVGLILFPVVLVAIAMSREILTLWLGTDFADEGGKVLQWLALGVFINGLAQVPSALIQGVGRPDLTFKLHLIELPPYLLGAWILIERWGIEGAAIAWTARTVLDLGLYLLAVGWVLPESNVTRRQICSALLASSVAFCLVATPFDTSHRLVALVVVLAAFGVLGWNRLLTESERSVLVSRFNLLRPPADEATSPIAPHRDSPRERPLAHRGP